MDIYGCLCGVIQTQYDTVRQIKSSERGSIRVVRHRLSGTRYIFREFEGSAAVYQKLLPVACGNLPQIMEAGERDGRVAVLEEYVQGDTLAFLLEGGSLSPKQARKIMRQLCSALWVLHSLGAVHRDIKPENVILRGNEAVLIDFDASRIVKGSSQTNTDTMVLGTTGYAAPEQYGISQTDPRADIYSLGVLLNVMLTGEHPSRCQASGKMGAIVRRCTMISPDNRYQNVLRLMEVL